MSSLYLNRLSSIERDNLIKILHQTQKGNCFICGAEIDLVVHKDKMDIDHVIPLKMSGKDDPSNFALAHSTCNRSKQASNLQVARVLHTFNSINDEAQENNRGADLGDILKKFGGSKYTLSFSRNSNTIRFCFSDLGSTSLIEETIHRDELSGFEYCFSKIPIEYLYHDQRINPRPIGQNISKLVDEFYNKRPQLHVSLAWTEATDNNSSHIYVFDGQHKAAAQILLGIKELPVRIFIKPDLDIMLTTNTNAGTTLRQVAFDKSIQRHLGNALYIDRVERYQKDRGFAPDYFDFSERDLVKYFKGESREMKRYILDGVRDSITHNHDNKLKDYITLAGKGKDKPISYSSVEGTFYSFFIYKDVLDTPINFKLEEGDNPRELEKRQILELMNVIAEENYIGFFDFDEGTYKIENRLQSGVNIPLEHVRACRIGREEIMYNWLKYIEQIIKNYFIMLGRPINEDKLFQYRFPQPLWEIIRVFIRNFHNLPLWVNKDLSSTVFGAKQNNDYWQTIFETGKSPQGVQVLAEPIDLMRMIQSPVSTSHA